MADPDPSYSKNRIRTRPKYHINTLLISERRVQVYIRNPGTKDLLLHEMGEKHTERKSGGETER